MGVNTYNINQSNIMSHNSIETTEVYIFTNNSENPDQE